MRANSTEAEATYYTNYYILEAKVWAIEREREDGMDRNKTIFTIAT